MNLFPIAQSSLPPLVSGAQTIAYIAAAILFIVGLKRLRSPKTARSGNGLAALGMLIAIVATFVGADPANLPIALAGLVIGGGIGAFLASRVQMTQMPQMVAMFNGFGGAASGLLVFGEFVRAGAEGEVLVGFTLATMGLSALIGAVTLSGSLVAAGKLQGFISGAPKMLPFQMFITGGLLIVAVGAVIAFAAGGGVGWLLILVAIAALLLGVALTMPIGGADMPVMVSLLNSYSGLAAAAAGFVILNKALIVSGALVGASGFILTVIMCKAMNRSLANVLFAGVGTADSTGAAGTESATGTVKSADADDVAIILDASRKIMIVPGYGLAVAQAQHAVRELADLLTGRGASVMYAIHPVAGRMPGHMNVLLAEADIPYESLLDLEQANAEIEQCDAVIVVGANDVVNPSARHQKASPIYGMPIIDVDKAGTCFVLKRSMAAGYAGVENELFIAEKTLMVFGDAKQTLQKIISALNEL
ncbi:MAG: NAD(P)(+) transhydrogenase (Re/Si-specific) subunit beta [Phycisphaeraceae bacterium]|nr:MAG: NAD(P)(+) transhydrogenase (Re/Si-specific) subunit beta [Phycisphaeraceae bacterium]